MAFTTPKFKLCPIKVYPLRRNNYQICFGA